MDPLSLIASHCRRGSRAYEALVRHGEAVARKALALADGLAGVQVNPEALWSACLLHDIGVLHTRAPAIGCRGPHPYIRHGVIGRRMLDRAGLPAQGRVCERHVGCGLSTEEIRSQNLPLPHRDMLPVTPVEQLVCYADKFYSKMGKGNPTEKALPEVLRAIAPFGEGPLRRFRFWKETLDPAPSKTCR